MRFLPFKKIYSCLRGHPTTWAKHALQQRRMMSSKCASEYRICRTANIRTIVCAPLSSTCHLSNNDVYQQQVRYFSADTYNKFFSPEVPPIGFAQSVLESVHTWSGLPWWASIAITTFTLRACVTLPLAVYCARVRARVEKLQPEMLAVSKQLKQEVGVAMSMYKWDEAKARREYRKNMKRLMHDIYVRENCHPLKGHVVQIVQLPVWLCMSFALRNMSGSVPAIGLESPVLCPELMTEGMLWFRDLTVPDPTFILPLSVGLINLIMLEMQFKLQTPTRLQKVAKNVWRGTTVILVPIAAIVPCSMCFYWACSSLFTFAQFLLLRHARVRSVLGMPK
ncbi:cytochrome c oxidase assembly protein COX18, mitochondrial-like [Haliotis cracherodii]|uniref:cytochrome c oxidase assembly protein COX18, mitochondrial-like n=1 Tax=Haliotis cracherodii TaxID=6455 RepID=UPI0039E85D4B